jgi:hypothetical protein
MQCLIKHCVQRSSPEFSRDTQIQAGVSYLRGDIPLLYLYPTYGFTVRLSRPSPVRHGIRAIFHYGIRLSSIYAGECPFIIRISINDLQRLNNVNTPANNTCLPANYIYCPKICGYRSSENSSSRAAIQAGRLQTRYWAPIWFTKERIRPPDKLLLLSRSWWYWA